MLYLAAEFWPVLAVALMIGIAVGWQSAAR